MQPLNDLELLALLDSLESDRAERKQTWKGSAPDKGREAVCAFANDLPNSGQPGVLFVGARDDGEPTGPEFEVTDALLQTLADIKTDGKTVPPPTLTVERRVLKGRAMAVVTVWPSDAPPVRYEGRIWIRIGPRRGLASAQDERILSEKRRYRDRSYDTRPVYGSDMAALKRSYFEHDFLPQAVAADVLEANSRSYEERLASLGMIASVDEPVPTVVGMLTLGKNPRVWLPGAYVQFLRIQGIHWGDPVLDDAELDGTLDTVLRRLDEKLKAHLATAVDFTSGSVVEQRSSAYPFSALQQVVRNAVMHRTYEGTNAPVRVYWFDDRIEVHSPGGPYGSVNKQNFGRPGASDYRNPAIAGVLRTLGFVQRFGFGIAEAKRSMRENGNPEPEFQVDDSAVLAILRRAP
ncbi:ATP-binding protein [Paucibacter sp. XJ19-41]|uniref:ATP-binding protein n=1 Tax=Paucibacter sp. XJ19-41 TaxID=2927824 RepID=UPI00234A252F|nr:ATP-binding protein [Paucibacter sp. XJ19-41]MDC6170864.1 ATP-binding protein [Paucibacter sp. XJ19-41]